MRRVCVIAIVAALVVGMTRSTAAHKPITSPFTFTSDVQPILRDRCLRCHVPGGVAPMSLLTHADVVPWGESMRGELMAGHMPPWSVDQGAARFRNPGGISARELNVLLTWLTGGTPPGLESTGSNDAPRADAWALGVPDVELPLPRFTLAANEQERVAEFVLPNIDLPRSLRAVDVRPGTAAIVRSATIEVAGTDGAGPVRGERVLWLWVPGDDPAPLAAGALQVPAGASLRVRVRYRKTWEYEQKEMADQSRLGLYAAPEESAPVQAVRLSPDAPVTLTRAAQVLAVYPDADLADAGVVVIATRPDGRRTELIAFHPRRGWARRYWFREPVPLPRGTRLSIRVTPDSPALLPPGLAPLPGSVTPPAKRPTARVTVNVL